MVFRIDPEDGTLKATGQTVTVPKPVCIKMMPRPAERDGGQERPDHMDDAAIRRRPRPGYPSGRPGSLPCSTRPTRSPTGRGASTTRCSASSPNLGTGNFTRIGTDDLERLFAAYDREFFRGRLGEMLLEDGAIRWTSACRGG